MDAPRISLSPPTANAADPSAVVTASDLVRHFGAWQERALRHPVYVLHRGRPRLVLTSVDVMQALCAPHDPSTATLPDAVADLLDMTDEVILLAGPDLALIASSVSARRYFGTSARAGAALGGIGGAAAQLLSQAARRVRDTGLAETIDIAAPYRDRRLNFAIRPFPAGLVLIARDATVAEELAEARAEARAITSAIGASGTCVVAHINLRGYVDPPTDGLSAFFGIDDQSILGARFTTLIEVKSRVAVGALLNRVVDDGTAGAVEASMLHAGAEPRPVQVALSPVLRGASVVGVIAFLSAAERLRRD